MSEWTHSADLVIVGSGGGALTAALCARSQGLEVLVLEKTELVGGSTSMSGGGLWIPNSHLMKDEGVADSEDDALTYFDAVVGDVGPASSLDRRKAYVENAPKMLRFLESQGLRFLRQEAWSDYYSDRPGASTRGRSVEPVPYDTRRLGPWESKLRPGMTSALGVLTLSREIAPLSYFNRTAGGLMTGARVLGRTVAGKVRGKQLVAMGTALVGSMLEQAVSQDVQIWLESPLADLVLQDGQVVGAVVRRAGRDERVQARRGVLLAAGGFARSDHLRKRFGGNRAQSAAWTAANPGDTGEVLELAMAHGAATDLLDEAIWNPSTFMPDGTRPSYPGRTTGGLSRARYRPGSIIVDAAGRRIGNESMSYMELGQRMFERNETVSALPSWLIFDDAFRRRYMFGRVPGRLPQAWIDDGFVKRADSLARLAADCGVDPAGLDQTVQLINEAARTGEDTEYHRGARSYDRFHGDPAVRPNPCLAPVRRAPFYAIAMFPGDVGTFGGVLTDHRARVLTPDLKPIEGLYAAGNITAGVMGRHYLGSGASIGSSCTFGYIAANDVAHTVGDA